MKLINLGNYLLSQTTLLRWLTFLLRSLTVTLTVLLFWIYLLLLTLAFVLQWLSFHWEILIILLHQFPLTFRQTLNGMSPWLAAACTTAIVHWNHFFSLYQQNKSSESKVKFRQDSNRCKRVLGATKLAYANKTNESITSQTVGSQDFWWIANNFSIKQPAGVVFCIW